MHILVVDDDPSILRLLAHGLDEAGYDVTTAVNGRAALELMESVGAFAAVVLDIQMPVLDGRDLIRELRGRGDQTPILILSAFGAAKVRSDYGADASLDKPFEMEDVLRVIRRLTLSAE